MSFFIKEITLSGFKSFAEKTTIQLKDGLNMIVGPNGCGKSNIVDAFSWAFGESQIKNLRSSVGTDVIFAGTEKRSGSFVAKVSFLVDNRQKLLRYDSPTVLVKRQINRDNESEFFINNVPCRLKDIQQLFLDTGLGKNTYSILQQGRIDQIVVGKPEDRRILIEEAAGIRNTKLIIKESQSKLSKTNDNLTRVEDILKEVHKQYEILKEQAQKALKFKELKEQIQKQEKEVFYLRLTWIEYKSKDCQKEINKSQEKLLQIEQKLLEIENFKPNSDEDLLVIQDKQEVLQKKKNDILIQEAQLTQKIEWWKKEFQTIKEKIEHTNQKKQIFINLTQEKEELAKDLSEKLLLFKSPQEELEKYTEQLIKEQESLTLQEVEFQNLLSHFLSREKNIEKKALKKILEQIKEEKKEYLALKSAQQQISVQLSELFSRISHLMQDRMESFKAQPEKFLDQVYAEYQLFLEMHEQNTENTFKCLYFLEKENDLLKQYIDHSGDLSVDEDFQGKRIEKEKQLEIQREKVQELRSKITQLEKQIKSFQEEYLKEQIQREKFQQEAEFYKNSISELSGDILDLQLKQEEYEERIEDAFLEYEGLLKDRELYENQWKECEVELKELEEKSKNQQKEEKELRKNWTNCKEKIQEQSIQIREVEIEQKLLLEEFTARYIRFNKEHFVEYQIVENLFALEQKRLAQKLQNLQSQIQSNKETLSSLGMVNFLAIEEFEAVEKRYEFLTQNKQDIERSQKDLYALIGSLQKQSEQEFLVVFNKVNEHLKDVFQIAFNGGTCQMKLTNQESPLEGGVEIIAQPPGKKLQNLNLLSGGEKTMVALSILFSLFMVKPAPFCLMDEVDAALDEMNIERFLRILNRFKDQVQFMIITHNRATAQKGDLFYGVTMQETGISKVFSFLPDNKGS